MTPVHGKDVIVYIYRTDDIILLARPVACATNCTLTFDIELVRIASPSTGRQRNYAPSFEDCTITVDGVVTLDELPMWQIKEFIDKIGVKLTAVFEMTNDLGDRLSYEMQVLTSSISITGDTNDFAGFSVSMKRCGTMTVINTFDALQDNDGNYLLDGTGHLMR
jgi:hypothetical protein